MEEFERNEEIQETVAESQTEERTQEPIAKQRVDASISWIDKVLRLLSRYSAKKILQSMLIIILIVFLGLFAFKPEEMFRSYNDYQKQEHYERMGQRTDVTPLIQAELDRIRITYGASWVSVWEFHNNTNNLDGLPFIFASLNYESMNPALTPIAEQFDDVRVSLYPLVTYLRQNDIWYGDVEDLQKIDHTAYFRAKALDIKYLGFKLMRIEGMPNAAISFAFVEGADIPENIGSFIQSWSNASYDINSILAVRNSK